MKVQRLVIEQQRAQIDITNQRGQLQVESNYHREMQVDWQPAKLKTDTELGKVMLDSTNLRENTGLRDVFSLQRHSADIAQQKAQQAIEQIVQDGDFTAQQPNSGNLIGQLALDEMLTDTEPATYGRSIVPEPAVKMTGVAGGCEIEWVPQQFEINWDQMQGPNITLEPPPSVDIRVVQDAQIECKVVEESIPPQPGKLIDLTG